MYNGNTYFIVYYGKNDFVEKYKKLNLKKNLLDHQNNYV